MEDQAPYGKVINQSQLKANELRIGNLILVKCIAKELVEPDDFDVQECNVHNIDSLLNDNPDFEFQPIPLTDEILHQTNLENEFSSEWKLYNPATEESFVIERFDDGYYYTGGEGVTLSRKIEYLHHLQNLCFDVMGLELIYTPKS